MSPTKKAAKKTVARKAASKPMTRNNTANRLALRAESLQDWKAAVLHPSWPLCLWRD